MPDPTPQEIEAQRRAAQELEASRKLIAKAWGDPNLRPGLRKHIKDVLPDYRLPDDDFDAIAAPLKAENEALKKQIGDFLEGQKKRDEESAKREQDSRDAAYATRLEEAFTRFALTEEGRKKAIEHMKATQSYDPMGAAAYIVSQEPPTLPSGPLYGSASLDFAGSGQQSNLDRYKLLHSGLDGPSKYLEAEIRDAFGPNGKDYVAREVGKTYAELAFAS